MCKVCIAANACMRRGSGCGESCLCHDNDSMIDLKYIKIMRWSALTTKPPQAKSKDHGYRDSVSTPRGFSSRQVP